MALTKAKIDKLVPVNGKARRAADGGGLFIEATPAGSKLWKMAYRNPKQRSLSLGAYPAVGLVEARAMREAAKKLLAEGKDPNQLKRSLRTNSDGKTFDEYAREFIEFRRNDKLANLSSNTLDKYEWSRSSVVRTIGGIPLKELRASEIVSALRVIEKTGKLHKAVKVRMFIDQVYDYANNSADLGLMKPGPSIRKALYRPVERNLPGLTDPHKVGELLRAIDGYSGDASTLFALRLSPHVFLRAGTIRALMWDWVDFEKREIEIPEGAMKMSRPHIVPMSRQVVELLRETHQFSGTQKLVFPSPWHRTRTLSENTLNMAIRRMGFTNDELVYHGLRTTASTLLNEVPLHKRQYSGDAIEMQMSHARKDKIEGAYNKAKYMAERVPMMQAWSDMLDEFRGLPPAK